MVRFLAGLALVLLLAGCQTTPGSFSDVHTGQSGFRSARTNAYAGLFSSVYAVAAYSNNTDKFAVLTEYSSSGSGWLFLDQAWSFGKQFPYTVGGRDTALCSGSGCVVVEQGAFEMSRADFEAAAVNGLEFKLIGSKGAVVCKLAPLIFQQVLQQTKGQQPSIS